MRRAASPRAAACGYEKHVERGLAFFTFAFLLFFLVQPLFALLNINKPAGVTSRDVVNHVQRIVRPAKVGHAGTLDPLARGVLVVCLGPATRLIEYVQRMPKRYTGTFLLGRSSDTDDIEGEVVELDNPSQPTRAQIEAVLPELTGEIDQQPPIYSALKIAGKRAYDLARRGEAVELASRKVQVHELRVVDYRYPELRLDVACGSGTYIRALGRDLAALLGTAAVMSDLVRTAIGDFHVADAVSLDAINAETIAAALLPPTRAVSLLPSIDLTADEGSRVANGQTIPNRWQRSEKEIVAFAPDGRLAAVLVPRNPQQLRPLRNFLQAGQ